MTSFDKIQYELKMHLKNHFWVYFFIILTMVIGLVLGIVLIFSENSYVDLLNSDDQNLLEYINGSANLSSLFFKRLFSSLLFIAIIFLSNMVIETSFLSVLVLGYQSLLLVLSCDAIISLQGASGVINCLLLILPVNIINLLAMAFFCGCMISRAAVAKKFRMNFAESSKYVNLNVTAGVSLCIIFIACIIHSVIIPLLIKSFIIINF